MNSNTLIASLALAAIITPISIAAPAAAQTWPDGTPMQTYTTWQPQWDGNTFDKQHVVLGSVAKFSPYRLTIARADGEQQTIDLKNGTLIYPTGATPTQGERAALIGYYSNGTFIANRVVLRP